MKIRILETRDFRGSIGMRSAGEIMDTEDIELVKQLEAQGLAVQVLVMVQKTKPITGVVEENNITKEDG